MTALAPPSIVRRIDVLAEHRRSARRVGTRSSPKPRVTPCLDCERGRSWGRMAISSTTVKRLFAESGNVCAFPGCSVAMIDGDTGTVVGEVCHIRARRPGGPRYDAAMRDAERDAHGNLLLLCGSHHKLVDSAASKFPVQVLDEMKRKHLARGMKGPDIPDAIATQVAAESATVIGGSIISTVNQRGGQVAHQIVNLGRPSRSISASTRNEMLELLRPHGGSSVGVASYSGDVEADGFKRQLMEVFRAAGWQVHDNATFMFFGARRGIVVTIPFGASEDGLPQVVASCMSLAGEAVVGNRGDMANEVGIYVQVWPAA